MVHGVTLPQFKMKLNQELQDLMYRQNMDAHICLRHRLQGMPRACLDAIRHFPYENDKRMTTGHEPVRGVAKPRVGRARADIPAALVAA